ncbi:MAG: BamA/TamA family outer membrane protein [Planctomycetota bacterium]|nr:BamA/TamA family outer membrane protein [Planctomycetota bacterium]
MTPAKLRLKTGKTILACVLSVAVSATPLTAAVAPRPTTRPATLPSSAVPPELAGRTVDEVELIGKPHGLTSAIQSEITHRIRTKEGDKFDPATVQEDYQHIYGLKKFSNVEARVEPTATGVKVVFEVAEQNTIKEIRFRGNEEIDTKTLQDAVFLKPGEGLDAFRLSLAKEAIERLYRDKSYPYVHVTIDEQELSTNGVVAFSIVEGPHVRIRKVRIIGNLSFTEGRIKDQIKTKSWFPFFVPGTYDPEQIDQDVASIRQYYQGKGFFDVRVGRKIVVSPTQGEVMVDFVIEEFRRYTIECITFQGNQSIPEADLRKNLKLTDGMPYDQDLVKRDIRQIVRDYSPLGFIFLAQEANPPDEYLRISDQRRFRLKDAGKVELVYDIHEGRPFRLGRIIVKGNAKTQDKVIDREMRVVPGQLWNSSELQRAQDRIKATNLFTAVTMTPIGDEPETRDLLVEVTETTTARFLIGAGITSNAGILGNLTYEQRNFDITNWPSSPGEFFSNRAFTGSGQLFRASIEPGTQLTRARVDWVEPWIFDQPYRFGASAYLSQRLRPDWVETRTGARLSLGRRFGDIWSAGVFLRGENVDISNIHDEALRAREVVENDGDHWLTTAGPEIRRDTTDSPILPSTGTITSFTWEHYGALGGEYNFDKFSAGWNAYTTLYEDLIDRKTILGLSADVGYITDSPPFFEAFYAGGIGSVRGFRYRGISPRSGIDEDPIGGNFLITGSAELSFPLAGDVLRGVVFADVGTVETDVRIGTLRSAVGFGFRLTLPFFGQLPMALDFAFPVTKNDQDDTRFFSFALGLTQ